MIEPESLLRQVQTLLVEKQHTDAVDLLLNVVDNVIIRGEFDYMNQLMLVTVGMIDECNMVIPISLLSATLPFKHHVNVSRDWLFSATMARATEERTPDKVKSLLNGLEGSVSPWLEEG